MTIAVELDRVSFRYPGGKAGIFDLSMQMRRGELVVCIGPSGCGKTTLLKLIAGFFRPESGRVLLGGEDVTAASVASRGCGIVFQSYALFPHMRVWENVSYPLRVRGMAPAQRRRKADEMLEMVGLTGLAERLPAQLSGGQQQRVALARSAARRVPMCCCSTSRCRRSMPRRGFRCATKSGVSRSSRTSPRC